ncbi:MAG: hypothetical protein ABJA66_03525 [Actinomycetota bacterium]
MLKRNLIIIAIASLVLIFTSNAFGQRKNRQAKAKTQSSTLSSPQTTTRRQYNPKEYSIEKLKNSTPTTGKTTQPNNYIGETEKNVKKPTTRRRQTNQTNTTAPTNSLMTIPTDVPNIKTKKPSTFIGTSDDGQSMRRKQKRSLQTNQPNAVAPTNQTPKIKPKKPVKPYIGGTDDGQSI